MGREPTQNTPITARERKSIADSCYRHTMSTRRQCYLFEYLSYHGDLHLHACDPQVKPQQHLQGGQRKRKNTQSPRKKPLPGEAEDTPTTSTMDQSGDRWQRINQSKGRERAPNGFPAIGARGWSALIARHDRDAGRWDPPTAERIPAFLRPRHPQRRRPRHPFSTWSG